MVMVFNTGLMELTMKVSGTLTKLRAKELFGMLKEMFITANSKMIWPMGMESTLILMAVNTRVSSKMMSKRVMAKKSGSMVPNMSVHTLTEWNMGMVFINGPTEASIKVIGTKTKLVGMENTTGMMAELTKDIGLKIICTDKASTLGLMVENTKVSIWMTKSMAMEFTHTPMADLTKVSGLTENSMEKAFS
jgi:hypothetical protein